LIKIMDKRIFRLREYEYGMKLWYDNLWYESWYIKDIFFKIGM
jgi:hypothetical protein